MPPMKMDLDTANWTKWNLALRSVISVNRYGVKVGVLEGSTNDEGENIAEYAAANEYGTPDIPPRPFLRSTVREKEADWRRLFLRVIGGKLAPDPGTVRRAFSLVGRVAQMDIKEKIMSNVPPPNAEWYAELKKKENGGYSGTLFNTGAMYKSINYSLLEDGKVMK